MKRRNFIKNILGAGTLGMLGFPAKNIHASAPSFNDYKALVCILLDGEMTPGIHLFQKLLPGIAAMVNFKRGGVTWQLVIQVFICHQH